MANSLSWVIVHNFLWLNSPLDFNGLSLFRFVFHEKYLLVPVVKYVLDQVLTFVHLFFPHLSKMFIVHLELFHTNITKLCLENVIASNIFLNKRCSIVLVLSPYTRDKCPHAPSAIAILNFCC